MEALGYPVTRGNAYTWKDTLPANGWTKTSDSPTTCPPGGILVFDRNDPPGAGGGAAFGHVEIVVEIPERRYVSDATRVNWGGTVPKRFVGCYVYPGSTTPVAGKYPQCLEGVQ